MVLGDEKAGRDGGLLGRGKKNQYYRYHHRLVLQFDPNLLSTPSHQSILCVNIDAK